MKSFLEGVPERDAMRLGIFLLPYTHLDVYLLAGSAVPRAFHSRHPAWVISAGQLWERLNSELGEFVKREGSGRGVVRVPLPRLSPQSLCSHPV